MVGRKTPFFKRSSKEVINIITIDTNLPDENYGENIVGNEKLGASKIMFRQQVPLRLWCCALEYYCDLSNIIVQGMLGKKVRTGYDIKFGNTLDIRKYVEF